MLDPVDLALQKFEENQDKQRASFELFLETNEDLIGDIVEQIALLKKLADSYDGYDFTEEMKEFIEGLA